MGRNRLFAAVGLLALAASASAQAQTAPSLAGDWSGTLQAGGKAIPLIFHVKGAPGAWTATLDSPSQSAAGLGATVVQTGDQLRLDLTAVQAGFSGVVSADGARAVGRWAQGGGALPLTLVHGPAVAAAPPNRPQTPRAPVPYRSEEVGYENPAGRNHLAGTLTLPPGQGPFPVVLLITGSGLQDRDETIFGHRPFLLWADTLTRRGMAVLRVDDRTIGGSTGEVRTATTADFATDVEAGVAYLKSRPDIDPRRIGLMGHSEGGVIAPMVAARDPSIAFIVMLAGLGEDGETALLTQKRLIETAMGAPAAAVAQSNALTKGLEDAVKDAPDQASADARLAVVWRAQAAERGLSPDGPVPTEVAAVAAPWMRWFLAFDPRPTLAKVRCPVLAVNGSKDLQVAPGENLAGIRAALHANADAATVQLPGLNHLLQTAGTGEVSEYGRIEETLSPLALKTVSDWIVAHAKP